MGEDWFETKDNVLVRKSYWVGDLRESDEGLGKKRGKEKPQASTRETSPNNHASTREIENRREKKATDKTWIGFKIPSIGQFDAPILYSVQLSS